MNLMCVVLGHFVHLVQCLGSEDVIFFDLWTIVDLTFVCFWFVRSNMVSILLSVSQAHIHVFAGDNSGDNVGSFCSVL